MSRLETPSSFLLNEYSSTEREYMIQRLFEYSKDVKNNKLPKDLYMVCRNVEANTTVHRFSAKDLYLTLLDKSIRGKDGTSEPYNVFESCDIIEHNGLCKIFPK